MPLAAPRLQVTDSAPCMHHQHMARGRSCEKPETAAGRSVNMGIAKVRLASTAGCSSVSGCCRGATFDCVVSCSVGCRGFSWSCRGPLLSCRGFPLSRVCRKRSSASRMSRNSNQPVIINITRHSGHQAQWPSHQKKHKRLTIHWLTAALTCDVANCTRPSILLGTLGRGGGSCCPGLAPRSSSLQALDRA